MYMIELLRLSFVLTAFHVLCFNMTACIFSSIPISLIFMFIQLLPFKYSSLYLSYAFINNLLKLFVDKNALGIDSYPISSCLSHIVGYLLWTVMSHSLRLDILWYIPKCMESQVSPNNPLKFKGSNNYFRNL